MLALVSSDKKPLLGCQEEEMKRVTLGELGSAQAFGMLCLLLGLVGIVAVIAMNPGILGELSGGPSAAVQAKTLQEAIPPGHRTITVSGQEIDGSVIWVTPGTIVDVFGNKRGSFQQVASGILILSVNGQLAMKEPPAQIQSMTFAVTGRDLEAIMLAKTQGKLSLSISGG